MHDSSVSRRSTFSLKLWPNSLCTSAAHPPKRRMRAGYGQTDSQVNANRNLRTDLRWVAKRIRKWVRKFTQVTKTCNFQAYTVDLRSTCVDLRWVAKRWKTCVDLRTNLSSTKVNASGWPNEMLVENFRWLASTCEFVWPGLYTTSTLLTGLP